MGNDKTGVAVFERAVEWLTSFVRMTPGQAAVCVLWACNTFLYDRYGAVPYIEIVALTKQSGKTTLLQGLSVISQNAVVLTTIRMLQIVRWIQRYGGKCTILFDEAEELAKKGLTETRKLLAGGYVQGAYHLIGKELYPTFAPYGYAQIGNVCDVLRDRGIPIELARSIPARSFTRERSMIVADGKAIRADFETWLAAHDVPVAVPEWLTLREQELWIPIWSLALALGLPTKTLEVIQRYSQEAAALKALPPKNYHDAQAERDALGLQQASKALRDVQAVLKDGERNVFSATLCTRLQGIATSPWAFCGPQGTGITPDLLALLLARYGVKSTTVRVGGRECAPAKGYRAADIRAASERDPV